MWLISWCSDWHMSWLRSTGRVITERESRRWIIHWLPAPFIWHTGDLLSCTRHGMQVLNDRLRGCVAKTTKWNFLKYKWASKSRAWIRPVVRCDLWRAAFRGPQVSSDTVVCKADSKASCGTGTLGQTLSQPASTGKTWAKRVLAFWTWGFGFYQHKNTLPTFEISFEK